MLRFAIVIFFSAFLLFQVQPIIAKYILPWFGGTSNVWTVCMLFFQFFLLLGYAYAHLLNKIFTARNQILVHTTLVLLALFVLPITPNENLIASNSTQPIHNILLVLFFSIGLPYFLISASGPLFQRLFEYKYSGKSTYRLYALSNVGSLLGLLSYPFLIEPNVSLSLQTTSWSWGFFVYFLLCLLIALIFIKDNLKIDNQLVIQSITSDTVNNYAKMNWANRLLWIGLAACGSILLLSITNQITLDIASVPFLWIIPLSLYLISFIISFDKPIWYIRKLWIPLFIFSTCLGIYCLLLKSGSTINFQVGVFCSILFFGCMVCHGELNKLKPHPSNLTEFYLLISLGGAIGGVFVALIAPLIFTGYWELHLALILTMLITGICLFTVKKTNYSHKKNLILQTSWIGMCAIFGITLMSHINIEIIDAKVLFKKRNFYGIVSVEDTPTHKKGLIERRLFNGTIVHGNQIIQNEKLLFKPGSYYGNESGVQSAIQDHPNYAKVNDFKVGIVGMGTATISALCKECSELIFYEIDPDVTAVSRKYYSYLEELEYQGKKVEIVRGDGRLALKNELIQKSRNYDVLVLDAFSGDAIPTHLLTYEAFELYWKHLKKDGILAVHISNRHLNLQPVVYNAAEAFKVPVLLISNDADPENFTESASWMILTNNEKYTPTINNPELLHYFESGKKLTIPLWTDDYSNLFGILN